MEVAGVVEDQAGGGTLDLAPVSLGEDIAQAPAVDAFRERRCAPAQVMKGRKEVPLHDGHVTLRTGLNPRTRYHRRYADAALEDGALAFLERAVEPTILSIHLTPLCVTATVIRGEDDIGIVELVVGLEYVKDGADVHVHFFDHGSVDNIAADARLLLLDVIGIPSRCNPSRLGALEGLFRTHVRDVRHIVRNHHKEGLLACVFLEERDRVLS